MPEKLKAKSSEFEQPDSTSSNLDHNRCEICGSIENLESTTNKVGVQKIGTPPANNRKRMRKILSNEKPGQIQCLELAELSTIGEQAGKHRFFFSYSDPRSISEMVSKKSFSNFQNFKLNMLALSVKRSIKIDKLASLDTLLGKLVPYNFQMKVALRVVNEMNGTSILADEVGLGKTIEAGLIMKELILRDEVASVLVVCPKSLLSQWKNELAEKFGEFFIIANNHKVKLHSVNRIICSHSLLAWKFNEFASRSWDLVIVDEAHAFRNTHSKGRACIADLPKNHLLMLTATPLCNKLTDLYSLVDLVQPGILDSERSFVTRFAEDARSRIVKSEETNQLKQILNQVMCRTQREQTCIPFTKRYIDSRSLDPTVEERDFLDKATEYLRDISDNRFKTIETLMSENPTRRISESQSEAILVFQAVALQQSFSSSPEASIESLRRRQQRFPSELEVTNKLIEAAQKVNSSKVKLLKQVLGEIPGEQALIFCLRRSTARKLKEVLDAEFGKAAVYLGDMSQKERENAIESFRRVDTKYLVATDAGAEGLNLQSCCVMFNYDLHWNPMKIEQRIGRIHRFKQDRDVTIFNLTLKDTIDDYVLHILYQKIDLFTMTVGKMETVLAEMKEGSQDIQKTVMNILLRSKSRIDIVEELEKLASDLNSSKANQELSEQFTHGVID